MKIIRHAFIAGKTILVRESPARQVEKGKKRQPKKNMTTEEVWKNNLKNAIFKLTLILNTYFVPGDHHLQLTYKEAPTPEQAKKDREKFVRKLRIECKKIGVDVRWVAVTEVKSKSKRIHHHIVCTGVPMEVIRKCWDKGHIFHNPLWDNPNYKGLAEYLLKEAAYGFREEDCIYKRRFNTSRNMRVPEGQKIDMKRVDLETDPKAPKGYYIDGEVEYYEHAITRLTCRDYVLVSLTDEPRLKRWPKGVTAPLERINYNKLLREAYHEEQLSLLWE